MTTNYTSLVTSEHKDKPNFMAVVKLLTQFSVDLQAPASLDYTVDGDVDMLVDSSGGFGSLNSYPWALDIDLATGSQLDKLGQLIGVGRNQNLVGFGFTILSDADYQNLLRAKIRANQWDGTMGSLQTLLGQLFPGQNFTIRAVDNYNMTMSINLIGGTPTAIQTALMQSDLIIPRPEGVQLYNFVGVTGPLFGLDYETAYISGPDVGQLQ